MATDKITINANVSADRKKVWNYYTQPEHITKWNFAMDTWHCPYASNDMRAGGKYIARMESKDGRIGFDFEGIYDEVEDGESFTYTMPDSRQVNVNFKETGGNTEVVVTFDPEEKNSLKMQRDGWQAILNNFKTYTESN